LAANLHLAESGEIAAGTVLVAPLPGEDEQ
jgi:hypothetical protein